MEDAGLYDLDADTVLVQTVDFITPVLDDPYRFGQAAAANALSDIYAMGARPVTGLNLVAFPSKLLAPTPPEASRATSGAAPAPEPVSGVRILTDILRGGLDKLTEAGAVLVGGHSVDDLEPKYGLAVTGLARRSELLLQSNGRPGDILFLTKPVGAGVLTGPLKRGQLGPEVVDELTRVLTTLNAAARDAALAAGARAATDVTGFGLLGHLTNLLLASRVGAEIQASAVPVIRGAEELARASTIGGAAARNLGFAADRVDLRFEADVGPERRLLLVDPMTSGGLLVAVPPAGADRFEEQLSARLDKDWIARIGRLTAETGALTVKG